MVEFLDVLCPPRLGTSLYGSSVGTVWWWWALCGNPSRSTTLSTTSCPG